MLQNTKQQNIRQMLLDLQMPPFLTDMAIPFMFFMPGTIDPDSPSVIDIIKVLQRGLRKLGYARVRVNGLIDRETAKGLDEISPHGSWMEKTFVQIASDILAAMRNPERTAHKIRFAPSGKGMSGYFQYEGIAPGPLPGFMVGTPPGPLGLGATATDQGVALEFGQGIANKTNIVPIPKSSGLTYNAFRNMQRQINRALSKKGTRIAEDGILGPGTYKALQQAQDVIGQSVPGDESTLEMARHAVSIAYALGTAADSMGISADANKGATSSAASRGEPTPPPMTAAQAAAYGSGGGVAAALKKYLPFLALAGGAAWYAASQRKKGKR